MITLATLLLSAAVFVVASGLLLQALRRSADKLADALARAPGLDAVVFLITAGPLVVGAIAGAAAFSAAAETPGVAVLLAVGGALAGLLAAWIGQIVGLILWCWIHETMHRDALRRRRIVAVLNSKIGRVNNHLALWWMTLAVPVFCIVRVAEYVVWPVLVRLTKLPRYDAAEWVNVSRHKSDGLVGHDLVWCLYCDWMTGVWSLGTEMLRNIESFWCPIRFSSPEKCANCAIDFPDVDGGWTDPADGPDAAAAWLDRTYPAPDGSNAWAGHPVRLTVAGRDADEPPPADEPA